MSFIFKDCTFVDNGTGITVTEGINLEVSGTSFIRNGTAVEVRDPSDVIKRLGLPADTPPAALVEALQALSAANVRTPEEATKTLTTTKLWAWIAKASDITTLTPVLMAIADKFFK